MPRGVLGIGEIGDDDLGNELGDALELLVGDAHGLDVGPGIIAYLVRRSVPGACTSTTSIAPASPWSTSASTCSAAVSPRVSPRRFATLHT